MASTKQSGSFKEGFVSRIRGHEFNVDEEYKTDPDLGVTVGNVLYGLLGYIPMAIIKKTALKNTKFGQFSLLRLGKSAFGNKGENNNNESADVSAKEGE